MECPVTSEHAISAGILPFWVNGAYEEISSIHQLLERWEVIRIAQKGVLRLTSIGSWLLLISMYSGTLLHLLSPFMSKKWISNLSYGLAVSLFLLAIVTNKWKFSKKFMLFVSVVMVYVLINGVLVSYKDFVFEEWIVMLSVSFLPMYLITSHLVDYTYLMRRWYSLSIGMTTLFPLYINLYASGLIHYQDMGHYSQYNLIPLAFFLFVKKERKFWNLVLLLANLIVGLVIGARSLFVTSIGTVLLMVIVLRFKRRPKYYFSLIILGVLAVFIVFNLREIVHFLYDWTLNLGIDSRNLYLFVQQLEGSTFESLSSGRSPVWREVYAHIKRNFGLPLGLGVTRHVTGMGFSHNVLLDLALVFGVVGAVLFLLWYAYMTVRLVRTSGLGLDKTGFFFAVFFSFWIRSLVDSYFVLDSKFYILLAMLLAWKQCGEQHQGFAIQDPVVIQRPPCSGLRASVNDQEMSVGGKSIRQL